MTDSIKSAFVELFEIHVRIPSTPIRTESFYLSNYGDVEFKRDAGTTPQLYIGFPIQLTGLDQTSSGAPPRPKLTIATIDPIISRLSFTYGDLVGSKVVYIRTFEEYLTAGVGSYPLSMEIYRKESHNKTGIVFELRLPTDREHDYLPKKQMLRNEFPGLGMNKRAS